MRTDTLPRIYADCQALLNTLYAPEQKTTIRGCGPLGPPVAIIAEAPNEADLPTQTAFTGRQAVLAAFCQALGLQTNQVYATYAIKIRPVHRRPDGRLAPRPPTLEEAALCAPFVRREMAVVNPGVVVAWGSLAAQAVNSPEEGWGPPLLGRIPVLGLPAPTLPLTEAYLQRLDALRQRLAAAQP